MPFTGAKSASTEAADSASPASQTTTESGARDETIPQGTNIPFIEDKDSFSPEFLKKAAKRAAEFEEEVRKLASELKAKEEAENAQGNSSSANTSPSPPPPTPSAVPPKPSPATARKVPPRTQRRLRSDLDDLPGAKLSQKFAKHLGEKPLAHGKGEKVRMTSVVHVSNLIKNTRTFQTKIKVL